MWQTIDTFEKPTKGWDIDFPKCLFYSKEDGIVIGRCYLMDEYEDEKEYVYHYDRDGLTIEPTHWMPLPEEPC
jgi:hypothetical protein